MPFDAIVAENGGVLRFWKNTKLKKTPQESAQFLFWQDNSSYGQAWPNEKMKELNSLFAKVKSQFAWVEKSSDQFERLYDLAIDFAEEIEPPHSFIDAQKIKEFCDSQGFVSKVSSIHVNVWKGSFSKYTGLCYLLENIYNKDPQKHLVYVGDSPNDAPLFSSVNLSVGVANIKNFIKDLQFPLPRFVTKEESSRGAIEVIDKLLCRGGL
jgi:hydroxymethylpyrimidine pyrophosphatase-like HAD family hydrolase